MHRPRARERSRDEVADGDGDYRAVSLWRAPPAQRDAESTAADQGGAHDAGSNGLKCPRCVTTASVPRENSVSSAEAARLDRTHQHGNALPLAIARFRRSTLTRMWRKIPAGFSPAKNRTWLSRLW